MVLPDFTAVLPQETPPEQLYRFGHVALLHSLDRVYKGAIHRSTLNDSLARGTEAATILSWLAEWNTPANVVETLREWIREYYRLYIADEPVLVSCDEKVTGEIASYEPLAGLIERVPAVAVFRIKPGAGESVRQVLSSMGYDYRMPTVEPPGAGHVQRRAARPDAANVFEPVVFGSGRPAENAMLKGKKYGSGLKALDLNETMHIIDYAILTGHELTVEYGGSPLIKKGLYTFFPTAISGSAEPMLDGSDSGAGPGSLPSEKSAVSGSAGHEKRTGICPSSQPYRVQLSRRGYPHEPTWSSGQSHSGCPRLPLPTMGGSSERSSSMKPACMRE